MRAKFTIDMLPIWDKVQIGRPKNIRDNSFTVRIDHRGELSLTEHGNDPSVVRGIYPYVIDGDEIEISESDDGLTIKIWVNAQLEIDFTATGERPISTAWRISDLIS